MELTLESGSVFEDVTENQILSSIEGEDFAILAMNSEMYMQCAEQREPPYEYILEYRDGSAEQHFQAVDGPITLERVISAFLKYLRQDRSWMSDFTWTKLVL